MAEALEHYAGCVPCQGYFRREQALLRRLGRLPRAAAPDELRARIAVALRAAGSRSRWRNRWLAGGGIAALAAAAVLAIVIARPPMPAEVTRPLVEHAEAGFGEDAMTGSDFADAERWLEERVGYAVDVPDISNARLMAVKVAMLGDLPTPIAMYVYANGRPVSYFAIPSADVMGFRLPGREVVAVAADGYQVAFWSEKGVARAVVAPMQREVVVEIAKECKRKALL